MTRLAEAAFRRPVWFLGLSVGLVLVFSIVFASTATRAEGRAGDELTLVASAVDAPGGPGVRPQDPAQEPAPAPARDRRFIGETRCANCHEDQGARYSGDVHSREWDPRTPGAENACETCHGPARDHYNDPEAPGLIRHFPAIEPEEVNTVCANCHNRQEHTLWEGSAHESRNLSCTSCHSVHESKAEPLLVKASVTDTCATCHQQNAAKLQRSAHMPVNEGKMECTSCHNAHGSTNVRLLRVGNSVNESCSSCHADKRGPYLWEHQPVRENCATCHDPHGSSNDRMLVARSPMLCQRCHVATRHPATVYDQTQFDNGNIRVIGRGCVNCHSSIHGSNHPAGVMFQR